MSEIPKITREEAWKLIEDNDIPMLLVFNDVLRELFTEHDYLEIMDAVIAEGATRALAKQEAGKDEKENPET